MMTQRLRMIDSKMITTFGKRTRYSTSESLRLRTRMSMTQTTTWNPGGGTMTEVEELTIARDPEPYRGLLDGEIVQRLREDSDRAQEAWEAWEEYLDSLTNQTERPL